MKTFFSHAIVRRPCTQVVHGLCQNPTEKPFYDLVLKQHECYIRALQSSRLQVVVLPANERYPDSCFVEDTVVCTPQFAVYCNSAAASRSGEIALMRARQDFPDRPNHQILSPGFLEGGDVMMVGKKLFVGQSKRSNPDGIAQLNSIASDYGWTTFAVPVSDMLHLKTGVSYLENNTVLIREDWLGHPAFRSFVKIPVPVAEFAAANCVWINDTVIMPAGYEKTQKHLQQMGYEVLPIAISEFQKIDGGVSCLSIRY